MAARRKPAPPTGPRHDRETPSGLIADDIVTEYRDLAPSVNRIMNAGLSEKGQLRAIEAFRDALPTPESPLRHPTNAIAVGQKLDDTA